VRPYKYEIKILPASYFSERNPDAPGRYSLTAAGVTSSKTSSVGSGTLI